MRRSASLLAVVMFSAFATVLLSMSSAVEAGGGNCQAKLVGNAYDCTEKLSDGGSVDYCWEFATGGTSANFDMYLQVTTDYGCACLAKGSFKSPSFDASSNAFECVAAAIPFQFNGKVSGDKLSGQGSDSFGDSVFFNCKLRSSPCP